MATEWTNIPGISSRRSACDKCRFSKSRCLRSHPEQPKCDRCTRADCECTTSPIFRIRDWQPSTGNDHVSRRRKSKTVYSTGRGQGNKMESISGTTITSSSKDHFSGSGIEKHPVTVSRMESCISSDSYSQPVLMEPCSISHKETNAYILEGIFDHSECDIEGTYSDFALPQEPFATIPMSEPETDRTPSLPFIGFPGINLAGGTSTSFGEGSSSREGNSQNRGIDENQLCIGTEQTYMQRLSQLDYELISLRGRLEQGVPQVIMQSLFEGTGKGNSSHSSVMNDILGGTTEFVDILSCLSKTLAPEIEPSSHSSTHISDSSSRRRSSSWSSSSSYDSDAADSTRRVINTPQLTLPSASEAADIELDTPALLLILASYGRLLRIYLIMFSHIYEHLRTISESDNPHMRPVLGLSISNYSAHSGNLQTLILIQIVTSHFEKIEVLLGLPVELRISRRRGERDGLFRAYGFLDVATTILKREDNETLSRGKGGIKALRRNIARAKSLLKERIAP